VWICSAGLLCLTQSPANEFRWDWRNVEKDGWEIIGQSKTLSATTRAGLIQTLASSVHVKSERGLHKIAAKTRVKAVDLSGKGAGEILAQAAGTHSGCSPTGNCESWVLQHNGGTYSVILHRGAAQTFTIQPTVTNGFHDIVLGMHGSAFVQELTLYRFDGSKYEFVACYNANWATRQMDGTYHNFEEPEITSCPPNE
jgi:hypothetical protein